MLTIKNHPFAVEAHFRFSLVVTLSAPVDELRPLVPPFLQLDTFNNHGFVAVAVVQTEDLRPKGFPRWMGNDFFLIGYRIFVRYKTKAGKELRGLYILKSETNKRKMAMLGNIFTHYKYSTADINYHESGGSRAIRANDNELALNTEDGDETNKLPVTSPFATWKEARRFAGPLPFTFTSIPKTDKVLIIEGVRSNWMPQPVLVKSFSSHFLNTLQIPHLALANAFIVQNVPYYWKKGKSESWNH